MINFKGSHYPKEVILYAVSYRDLEDFLHERGVDVDHATLNRWVVRYSPLIANEPQHRKSATGTSWWMDETYIKVKGRWMYQYRAIDKSGANLASLQNMNVLLMLNGWFQFIDILQVKYLNNIIEQDHRFIKKISRPMTGFKVFHSASATLEGIEVAHMIRKNQFASKGQCPFQQFANLAA